MNKQNLKYDKQLKKIMMGMLLVLLLIATMLPEGATQGA